MSVGSAWTSDKALYNRPARFLKYDGTAGQGEFQSEAHILYTQVTDLVIHKATKSLQGRSTQHDAGFLNLAGFGCKRSVFKTKHS